MTTGPSTSNKRAVLWFRNDLRLHDNVIVHEAARRVKAGSVAEVLPLFCFDPRFLRASKWGNAKTGPYRAQFLLESVLDLKQRLQGLGSDLLIHLGQPEEVLPGLVAGEGPPGSTVVLAGAEVTSEEITVERKVRAALAAVGAKLELHWGPSLYHLEDLPFREDLADMPDVFTPFKNACESKCQVRPCLPTPVKGALPLPAALPQQLREQLAYRPIRIEDFNCLLPKGHKQLATIPPDPRGVLDFKGGETAALARLKYYLWETDLIATYFETRNGMVGGDYSSKFAPWLSHGCLSPRTVYHEVKKYEAQRVANKSTYWVIFELIWRDYFRFYALKHGNCIFFPEGPAGRPVRWASDPELLRRWKEGRTWWPLVDANMRELAATGFMSNRGRQNVASFLALDLGLDWRLGADWFEHLLIDYDVPSNWGNWVAAAGLTGGRVNKFNITKQSKDYDLNGDYIRRWVPELAKVPAPRIHEPWLMSRQEQEAYGVQIGSDYPAAVKGSGRPAAGGSERRGGSGVGRGRGGGMGGGHSKGSSGAYRGMAAAGGRGGADGGRGGGRSFRARSTFDMYG